MKALMTAVATAALIGALATGGRSQAGDDCDTVVKSLDDALSITVKNFDTTMDELKKIMAQPADDKSKVTVKNKFCSASGEVLGTSRAARAIAGECSTAGPAIASLDKSIKEMETAIDNTCK
jgi:hypothetical protein